MAPPDIAVQNPPPTAPSRQQWRTGPARPKRRPKLPDPDARHVLTAALRSGSRVIVTENIKDFPAKVLDPYNIEAQTPDAFVLHLIDLAPGTVSAVTQGQQRCAVSPHSSIRDIIGRGLLAT